MREEKTVGTVRTQSRKLDLPDGGFPLDCGASLPEVVVAYETYGKLNVNGDNTIFICHALTGDAHVAGYHDPDDPKTAGWWESMVGPKKGIDTNLYYVICANILGGCSGTTGPSSTVPGSDKRYGSTFPKLSVRDMVRAHKLLLDALGIHTLASVVGGSFGGMQALEWLLTYPDMVQSCVCIASADSLSTQALAFDVVGRRAILDDPDWKDGDYYDERHGPTCGLAQARRLAHITYLSPELMSHKFGREKWVEPNPKLKSDMNGPFTTRFEVESYLEYQGQKFVDRFDANSYLHISQAMDEFDLARKRETLCKAFSLAKGKSLFVALSSDWLFPPEQARRLVSAAICADRHVNYCQLYSPNGHDDFLVNIENLAEVIHAFLPWVVPPGATPAKSGLPPGQPDTVDDSACDTGVLRMLIDIIPEGSKVLDLGCGDGKLLNILRHRRHVRGMGVDIDLDKVMSVIDAGHEVIQTDIDSGLAMFPDNSYDIAIVIDTLQAVRKPRGVLKEVARIAKSGIVSFPNFGNWMHRFRLWRNGRMPKGDSLPYEWYNTPNIHLFTLLDFRDLCQLENLRIERIQCLPRRMLDRVLVQLGFCNLGADRVVAQIRRNNFAVPERCSGPGTQG